MLKHLVVFSLVGETKQRKLKSVYSVHLNKDSNFKTYFDGQKLIFLFIYLIVKDNTKMHKELLLKKSKLQIPQQILNVKIS